MHPAEQRLLGCKTPPPPPLHHQHLQQSCKVLSGLLQGCVTRAAHITPRTHYQRDGLLRADHKYGGGGISGPCNVPFICQQVEICAGEEKCIDVLDVNDVHVQVRGLQILHKNQQHVVALQVSFHCMCTPTLMTASSR